MILHADTHRPLGLVLSQHNYHRTYIRGEDFKWPEDNRVSISYAVRSNEPYLITEKLGSRSEPTIGNPSDISALYGRTFVRPISSGYDKIVGPSDGARDIRMRLKHLPSDDPLYTSTMNLGDRRRLFSFWPSWYREGPPGMDYFGHPALNNLADLAAFWYIDPEDDRFFSLLEQHPYDEYEANSLGPVLTYQKRRLIKVLNSKF